MAVGDSGMTRYGCGGFVEFKTIDILYSICYLINTAEIQLIFINLLAFCWVVVRLNDYSGNRVLTTFLC
jgi:hypothetical protein